MKVIKVAGNKLAHTIVSSTNSHATNQASYMAESILLGRIQSSLSSYHKVCSFCDFLILLYCKAFLSNFQSVIVEIMSSMAHLEKLTDIIDGNLPVSLRNLFVRLLVDKKMDNSAKRKAVFREVFFKLQAAGKLARNAAAVYSVNFKEAVRSAFLGTRANHDVI